MIFQKLIGCHFSPFKDNFIISINHPLTKIALACAEPSLDYFQHLKLHAQTGLRHVSASVVNIIQMQSVYAIDVECPAPLQNPV